VTQRRAAARQRQVDIGKARPEYVHYVKVVPKDRRTPTRPRTPDPYVGVSKRQFDRQLAEWRRQLHEYDTPSSEASSAPELSSIAAAPRGRKLDFKIDHQGGFGHEPAKILEVGCESIGPAVPHVAGVSARSAGSSSSSRSDSSRSSNSNIIGNCAKGGGGFGRSVQLSPQVAWSNDYRTPEAWRPSLTSVDIALQVPSVTFLSAAPEGVSPWGSSSESSWKHWPMKVCVAPLVDVCAPSFLGRDRLW